MKSTLIDATSPKTWALIFDKGGDPVAGLTAFAKSQNVGAAHFTAIGAFSDVTLGYFGRAAKDYTKIPLREQVEALSLIGDVALYKGEPRVHAHVVVGRAVARRAAATCWRPTCGRRSRSCSWSRRATCESATTRRRAWR